MTYVPPRSYGAEREFVVETYVYIKYIYMLSFQDKSPSPRVVYRTYKQISSKIIMIAMMMLMMVEIKA